MRSIRDILDPSLAGFALALAVAWPSSQAALAAGAAVKPLAQASAIQGMLAADPACAKDAVHIWLSQGKILIYQVEVPVGGDFELHTLPGSYLLAATGRTGCYAEAKIEAKADETHAVTLKLAKLAPSKSKRDPASVSGKKRKRMKAPAAPESGGAQ